MGLDNPLNAMQILFINILMDGGFSYTSYHTHFNVKRAYLHIFPAGPPSQSLGVDPVDPAVMRRPPRKKNAPIITKRLLCRVLFSASIIVVGTLFIYVFALKDKDMSRREQTMVSFCFSLVFFSFLCFRFLVGHLLPSALLPRIMRRSIDRRVFLAPKMQMSGESQGDGDDLFRSAGLNHFI